MNENTHLDLFSGIGGFSLAAQWAGFKTVVFCERDKFCQKILRKHWPDVPIIEDIFKFDGKQFQGVTLLTGGFPCQPFSRAGKQRGKEDDRYLWPEMLRVIKESRPTWIIGENVTGIIELALESICVDLENQNYEVWPLIIPACAVNAPHKRDRLWIVAHSNGKRLERSERWAETEIQPFNQFSAFQGKWDKLPKPAIRRGDDGFSSRVDRLKALGNAIVPQVAYEIMTVISSPSPRCETQASPAQPALAGALESRAAVGGT